MVVGPIVVVVDVITVDCVEAVLLVGLIVEVVLYTEVLELVVLFVGLAVEVVCPWVVRD